MLGDAKSTGLVFKSRQYVGSATPPSACENVARSGGSGTFGGGAASPTWTRLPSGLWYLDCDGADYVLDTNAAVLALKMGTIRIWFKGDPAARAPFACSDKDTVQQNEWYITSIGTQLSMVTYIGSSKTQELKTTSSTYTAGAWHCFAVRSSGTAISMNLNGVAQAVSVHAVGNTGDFLGDLSNGDNFSFGSLRRSSPTYFTGGVGEVSIYSYVLPNAMLGRLFDAERQWYGL